MCDSEEEISESFFRWNIRAGEEPKIDLCGMAKELLPTQIVAYELLKEV